MRLEGCARFCIAATLSLGGCGGEAARDPSQWPIAREDLTRGATAEAAGAATFRQYCTGCHGVDGRGNAGVTGADFLSPTSPLLRKSDDELAASVRDGVRGATATMPAHRPVLSDPQIAAVIAYVRATFKPPSAH